MNYSRLGKRWTINECLQLQREFELLKLSIDEIAVRHQRTPNAIMFKLDQEGFADYNVLFSNYHMINNMIPLQKTNKYEGDEEYNSNDEEEDSEFDDEDQSFYDEENEDVESELKAHVLRLEKQVNALTEMFMKNNKSRSGLSLFS